MQIAYQVFELLGLLLRAVAFALFGFGAIRFALNAYEKGNWQVQVALALGIFAMMVGLTNYASPGSAGAFALGAGIAFLGSGKKKEETSEEKK
ncbi:MAG: hypothetical protein HZB19_14565 [Chloroflexi bacterium]|nr:hypothetical protein [Chloroflexota bacterium]